MARTFRYRLFKVGALPESLRAEVQNDEVIFMEEGVPVTVRRHGTGPGFRGGGIGRFSGAFAVTNRRIVASISKTVVMDAPCEMKDAKGAEASFANDGLHITIDASIHPQFTGEIQMHFKHNLSETELARFPCRKIIFQFPADLVPKMFGVPA
jgi:hypothetical protein